MANLSEVTPWSNNPNAPDIPNWLYLGEKAYFTGFVIDAMLYGTQASTYIYPSSPSLFDLSFQGLFSSCSSDVSAHSSTP